MTDKWRAGCAPAVSRHHRDWRQGNADQIPAHKRERGSVAGLHRQLVKADCRIEQMTRAFLSILAQSFGQSSVKMLAQPLGAQGFRAVQWIFNPLRFARFFIPFLKPRPADLLAGAESKTRRYAFRDTTPSSFRY